MCASTLFFSITGFKFYLLVLHESLHASQTLFVADEFCTAWVLHTNIFIFLVFDFCLQLKRVMESDAAMTEDLVPFNIIPLDAPTVTNPIAFFPEVNWFYVSYSCSHLLGNSVVLIGLIKHQVIAAASSLKYFRGLPKLPATFSAPATRSLDMFDFLQYTFGFQVSLQSITV